MRFGKSRTKLEEVQRRISAAKADLAVLGEQLEVWRDMVDDLKIRSLVSEDPQNRAEYLELSKHVVAATAEMNRRAAELQNLIRNRDELLRQWVPKDT